MNLILDPWIPVVRRDGSRVRIAPWQLTEALAENWVLRVDASRASWSAALTEFLVALVQTAAFPEDAAAWRKYREAPPSSAELRRELRGLESFFELEGGVPFMQDPTLLADGRDDDYRKPIQKLLVDEIGAPIEERLQLGRDIIDIVGAR